MSATDQSRTGAHAVLDGSADATASQALLREINERVNAFANSYGNRIDDLELVCECENGCLEHLNVAPDDYELVRRFPTRFLLRVGHVSDASERVVREAPGYVVVEKIGPGAVVAVQLDPRRRTGWRR